jgi:hypothetical protein
MSVLEFRVNFHTPFRVGTGTVRPGVGQTAYRQEVADQLLIAPASTVKGVMRAAALELLPDSLVAEVFGGRGTQCGWSWSGLTVPATAVHPRSRTRIEIEPATGTVAKDMLAVAEELVISEVGSFTVRRLGFLSMATEVERRHRAVLRVAAGLVSGAGGTRRRGLGWISVDPSGVDAAEQAREDLDLLAAGGWL